MALEDAAGECRRRRPVCRRRRPRPRAPMLVRELARARSSRRATRTQCVATSCQEARVASPIPDDAPVTTAIRRRPCSSAHPSAGRAPVFALEGADFARRRRAAESRDHHRGDAVEQAGRSVGEPRARPTSASGSIPEHGAGSLLRLARVETTMWRSTGSSSSEPLRKPLRLRRSRAGSCVPRCRSRAERPATSARRRVRVLGGAIRARRGEGNRARDRDHVHDVRAPFA